MLLPGAMNRWFASIATQAKKIQSLMSDWDH